MNRVIGNSTCASVGAGDVLAMAWSFMIPFCVVLVWATVLTGMIASAQESASSENQRVVTESLPRHAVWRFGDLQGSESHGFYRVAISPDGTFIAARNHENRVEIRNVRTQQLICTMGGHDSWISVIEFSPDSRSILTAAPSGKEHVQIWDVRSGKRQAVLPAGANHAAFSSDGRSIFVLTDKEVQEWNWANSQLQKSHRLRLAQDRPLLVSADGQLLLTSQRVNNGRDHLTKLVDLRNDSTVILDGPPELPSAVALSANHIWGAAIYARQSEIRLWDLRNPSELDFVLKGHEQGVQAIAFSGDCRFLVSSGWDQKAVVWDLLTRERLGTLDGHAGQVNTAMFGRRSMRLATGSAGAADGTVLVWDLARLYFPYPPKSVSEANFATTWKKLGSSNPVLALRAVHDLRYSIDEIFELLDQRIGQPSAISRGQIGEWIAALDAGTFLERERASKQLLAISGQAEPMLRESLEQAPSTEVRYRIQQILNQPAIRPEINPAELRRLHRSIFLLELVAEDPISRPHVIALLEAMAQNHPHFDIARDAASALRRVEEGKMLQPRER